MKRVIKAASRADMINHIKSELLKTNNCIGISVLEDTNTYVRVQLKLSNNEIKTATIWFDYKNVKNGTGAKYKYEDWDSSFTINKDGRVFDSFGNYIGKAKILVDTGDRVQKRKKSYDKKSVRSNIAETDVQNLNRFGYDNFVNELMNR